MSPGHYNWHQYHCLKPKNVNRYLFFFSKPEKSKENSKFSFADKFIHRTFENAIINNKAGINFMFLPLDAVLLLFQAFFFYQRIYYNYYYL